MKNARICIGRQKNVKKTWKKTIFIEKSLCKAEHFSGVSKTWKSKNARVSMGRFLAKNAKKRKKTSFFVFFRVFSCFWGFWGVEKTWKNEKKWEKNEKKMKKKHGLNFLCKSEHSWRKKWKKLKKKWKNVKKTQKNVKKRQKSDKIGHFSAKSRFWALQLHFLTLFARASIGKSEFPARMTVYLEPPPYPPPGTQKPLLLRVLGRFLGFFSVFSCFLVLWGSLLPVPTVIKQVCLVNEDTDK